MKYLIPFLILLAALFLGKVLPFNSKPSIADSQAQEKTQEKPAVSHEEVRFVKPITNTLTPAQATAAAVSLKKMSMILFDYTAAGKSLDDLVKNLKAAGHEPFLVRDKNAETGEMIIVRTKSPPSGTRYFHAQYFTDEANQTFAQHMSFEFRASPVAMNLAIQAVRESFPALANPTNETRDFIQWSLNDGYVVWIKRLGPEDIHGNPFNSYSHEDIGSIRIAVELAPEGH